MFMMRFVAAACALALTLYAFCYLGFNRSGASISFLDKSARTAVVAHIYVLSSGQDSLEARNRKAAIQTYLEGVPFTEVHPDVRHLQKCTNLKLSFRHQRCTAGHMAILDRIVANTSSPAGSFSIIFEDDMCPTQLIGTGAAMVQNIARALAQTSEGVTAVNLGICNGKSSVERARAKLISADCHVLNRFGPCSQAWATTRAQAPKLLRALKKHICNYPIDIILSSDSANRVYEHIACKDTFPINGDASAPEYNGRLFHQCYGSSLINPV